MSRTVVVIGASGFIGRAVRARLHERFRLVCVDVVSPRAPRDDETWLEMSVDSREAVDTIWEEFEPDDLEAVIHLAAYYDFKNEPDDRYEKVIAGLDALLGKMGTTTPDATFLFSSSMAALAATEPGEPLDEESPRNAGWAYPSHKVRAEQMIEAAEIPNTKIQLVLAGVYSEWCELVPLYKQIERVRKPSLETYFYPGPVDRGLTYVHVDEVARAFERGIDAGLEGSHRFLIGEPKPVTYETIQHTAARVFHGKKLLLLRIPAFIAWIGSYFLALIARLTATRRFIRPWMVKFAGEHFEFDLTRSRKVLGWDPEGYMGDELAGMCGRAMENELEWMRRNDARPF